MAQRKFDIWQGPIIGYGDATGLSAGGKFKRPDDVEIPPRPRHKTESSDYGSEYRRPYSANDKKGPSHRPIKQVKRNPWQELKDVKSQLKVAREQLKIARDQLAKAKRDKEKRTETSARLRYMQTCLMRLSLVLTTFVGDADDFFDVFAAYPFNDDCIVARQEDRVTAKNAKSKTLRLEASFADDRMVLALYGGKNFRLHSVEAQRSDEYAGVTWRVIDLW